ncbi:17493_t:CDS:2 [Entrophospora sp. SA101]|nr:17493_t:CDS:2 [Entrophospora sp. SA101]
MEGQGSQKQQDEDGNNRCPDCGKEFASLNSWCRACSINQLRQQFINWTSGNKLIDELIQETQLTATSSCNYLEWIPFENIELRQFKSEGGYSAIYSAVWLEGPKWIYDEASEDYTRTGPTKVALKRFNNLNSITVKKYLNCLQCGSLADCFGITKDSTSCYMFVMKYYENGNLYQYLNYVKGVISWRDMIDMLWDISCGLEKIHSQDLFHGNLHGGNLLIEEENVSTDAKLADVGFYGPVSNDLSFKRKDNKIYGVLPFVAPEILMLSSNTSTKFPSSDDYDYNDQDYCYFRRKSDIYSFGITMWTLASGVKPWCDRAHDEQLAIDICKGLRPEGIRDMPKYYKDLMERCWHSSPDQRPTARELTKIFSDWIYDMCDNPNETDISIDFSKAEDERWKLISRQHNKSYTPPKQHPQAFYTSREFYFPNLTNQ